LRGNKKLLVSDSQLVKEKCPFCVPDPNVEVNVLFCESCRVRELGELRSWLDSDSEKSNQKR